ncbi:MAG TPA: 3-deoxy-D-manno-octulosonic acid transferase [Caulobacteraceae bacterium]|jgi:3-deoxy-D-manno-octulosonic-acid transferase
MSPPPRSLSLAAYRLITQALSPLAAPLLRARARRGKEDPDRLGERLGHASAPRPEGPLVWMHAISVGESVSLLPLAAALADQRPDLAFLVTSGTRASAEVMARRLPAGAIHQYAPIDTPGAVARFLGHWRPQLGLFCESELWPNLILGARRQGARLALVSARMTDRSARAWRARPSAARAMLRCFDEILVQDAATAERLTSLGGAVSGRLNLKRLGAPLACDTGALATLTGALGARQVVVAASTHAGEEALIAGAVETLDPRPLLIVAPRHIERGAEIAAALASGKVARRAAGEALTPDTEIYVADTLSELGLWLRLADVAVVGGSFGRGIGGHNPLEPARLGVGAITGPDVANFADIYAEMIGAGAATMAEDEAELAGQLAAVLEDAERLGAMRAAAGAYAARQGDQLAAALAALTPLLPAPA